MIRTLGQLTKSILAKLIMINLENVYLEVQLNTIGAELTRIYSKETGLDYLWPGDEAFWERQAPVLFPIIGKLKGGDFRYLGEYYKLPQHGFARNQQFDVVDQTSDAVRLSIKSNEETLKVYPFRFELVISYQLVENSVKVSYRVMNQDEKEMAFSIGGHPGFRCPLEEGLAFEDYYLEFDEPETPTQIMLSGATSLRSGMEAEVVLGNKIKLDYALFKNDALIYEGLKSKQVHLKSSKSAHGISFSFEDWRYLAFWTKPDAPFICFEPWCGIADADDSNGLIWTKKGIEKLESEQKFEVAFQMAFF